jgi:hypothetical protein
MEHISLFEEDSSARSFTVVGKGKNKKRSENIEI